jgi:hypothetical protein
MRFKRSRRILRIDCPLADGFSYVSGHAPAFASHQLLAFCEQYLNRALEEEEVLGAFQGMDTDGDGSVASSDWAAYFSRAAAVHGRSLPRPPLPLWAPLPALPSTLQPAHLRWPLPLPLPGIELQDGDISELLLATLLQLQQELVLGAAHALLLHGASSLHAASNHASDKRNLNVHRLLGPSQLLD